MPYSHVVPIVEPIADLTEGVFGSDFPMFQQWQALREMERSLNKREFELVTSGNARRLLGLDVHAAQGKKVS